MISNRTYARIAAIATTITAIAAVVIAVSDNMQTRKHDRLSVVPYLTLRLNVGSDSSRVIAHVALANEGVGPAVVDSVQIILPDSTRYHSWQSAQTALTRAGLLVRGYIDFGSREAIGAGRSMDVLTVQEAKGDSNKMFDYLPRINVIVAYHSIYGEAFRAALQNP